MITILFGYFSKKLYRWVIQNHVSMGPYFKTSKCYIQIANPGKEYINYCVLCNTKPFCEVNSWKTHSQFHQYKKIFILHWQFMSRMSCQRGLVLVLIFIKYISLQHVSSFSVSMTIGKQNYLTWRFVCYLGISLVECTKGNPVAMDTNIMQID